MQKFKKYVAKQNGAALIIFTVILSLFVLIFSFKTLNGKELESIKNDMTAKALFEAKNALLGWSVIQNRPGLLPCPEDPANIGTPNEGNALASCNFAIGRLPWKTLELGDLRDGNGDHLWYALSSGFGNNSVLINSATLGQLSVNGAPNSAVAIIFSPGPPLNGQVRTIPTSVLPPVVSDYLDLSNNDGDVNFTNIGAVNDKLISISHADLFNLVAKRILREVRGDNSQGLNSFYNANSNFPYADVTSDGTADVGELGVVPIGRPSYAGTSNTDPDNVFINSATLINNSWMPLINYQVSADRQTVTMNLNGQVLNLP